MSAELDGTLAGRSITEWVIRGVLAALCMAAAFLSIPYALAPVVGKVDPEFASKLAPTDGRLSAKLAAQLLAREPALGEQSHPARLARLALRQDPTAVEAASLLGLQAQLHEKDDEARRWFAYIQSLSRRELRSQLWAIEQAVNQGDIRGALQHYDVALRTSRAAPDILYPILVTAIAEAKIRSALIDLLRSQPAWTRSFLNYLAVNVVRPAPTVEFLREGDRVGLPINREERTAVVNAIAGRGDYDLAWNYYASFRSQADPRRSRDPNFLLEIDNPATFDWTIVSDLGAIASIQSGENGGIVDFAAPSGMGGALIRQTQLLPAGAYRIDGHSIGIDLPADSLPYWSLTCQNGRELGKVTVPPSSQSNGRFSGTFEVPSGCPVQSLSFIARSSNRIAGATGQIDYVLLRPL